MAKLGFSQCCAISRSVAQCPHVLHNVKMGYAMHMGIGKVPNPVAINNCYADYSVRHLKENEEKTKFYFLGRGIKAGLVDYLFGLAHLTSNKSRD